MTKRSWILLGLLVLVAVAAPRVGSNGSLRLGTGKPGTGKLGTGDSESVLRSLAYLTWVPADETTELTGVTLHDPDASWAGLNLYSPRESHRAFLLDMEGNVLHRWDVAIEEGDAWQLVEPLDAGELLVIDSNKRLMRIDRDSRVLWTLEGRIHHDAAVAASGEIYTLSRRERTIERSGRELPILDDVILRLSAEGEITAERSILELFGDHVPDTHWRLLERWLDSGDAEEEMSETAEQYGFRLANGSPADLFHTNSIEILPRGLPGIAAPGALLVSIRELSLVAIVDFDAGRVDWRWRSGVVRRQHHPSLLDNGNILIYDNLGGESGLSRIVEVDPSSGEIVWEYNGRRASSRRCAAAASASPTATR